MCICMEFWPPTTMIQGVCRRINETQLLSVISIPIFAVFAHTDTPVRSLTRDHTFYATAFRATRNLDFTNSHRAVSCMPRFLTPKKSTEHRVAGASPLHTHPFHSLTPSPAIALYRALLSGCSSAALPDDDRTALRNAIRNKFRQNRKLQSAYQLGLSFKLGYEVHYYAPCPASQS